MNASSETLKARQELSQLQAVFSAQPQHECFLGRSLASPKPLRRSICKEDLFSYMGGIVRDLKAVPMAVGGIEDHAHLLLGVRSWLRLDYLLRDIKTGSSKWVKNDKKSVFAWQRGYAAFSVSPDRIKAVERYILNQEEHHKKYGFEDELVMLLDESGIPYDPKYLL